MLYIYVGISNTIMLRSSNIIIRLTKIISQNDIITESFASSHYNKIQIESELSWGSKPTVVKCGTPHSS